MIDKPLDSYFPKLVSEVKGFAIFMIDENAIISTWNAGCELMKGYKKEEAVGQPFSMLFPDFLKDEGQPEKEVQQAKETGRYEGENWRLKKNGQFFWAHVVLTRITDEDGKLVGYVKITQDQTDKKNYLDELTGKVQEISKINSRLDNLNGELIKANSRLEEFAYASSHDLQAPLRKMKIFVERLKKELWEKLNEQQINLFDRIDDSATRMLTLIDDLLGFSYITRGSEEFSEIDLNEIVKNVLEDLELDIAEKRAKIKLENLPRIHGNSRQFQQFFQNLIGNAIKYTREEVPPEIQISSREVLGSDTNANLPAEASDKRFNLIELKDNGIGFEPEHAEVIFTAFTRLHTNSEFPGSGIGLSIVQKVVESHKGYVWAESIPGEGANFKVLLPIT